MSGWSGYDSLLPSEHDLGQDWRKMPVLPEASLAMLREYTYATGRRPDELTMPLTDGMVAEAADILKDGGVVPFHGALGHGSDLMPNEYFYVLRASHGEIRRAVEKVVDLLRKVTRLPLVLIAEPGKADGIVLDDKDGRDIPEVRFWIAPGTRCGRCNDRVCSCPPTEAERYAVTIRESLSRDRSATVAENGRNAPSPSEIR